MYNILGARHEKGVVIMRICVVDDEPIICRGAESMIRDAAPEAQIDCFTDPFQAWEHLQQEPADVVFLDIEMPGVSGIDLAKKIKAVHPECNIIFVTAYEQYQRDAWGMHASGYVLKPPTRQRIAEELKELRHPVAENPGLFIQTFGHFEVYFDGTPVKFGYTKTKELLAILVDHRGTMVSQQECIETLWGKGEVRTSYYKRLRMDLVNTLAELGLSEVILKQRGQLGLNLDGAKCDYFDWLSGRASGINAYHGAYMEQYPWAEKTRMAITAIGKDRL